MCHKKEQAVWLAGMGQQGGCAIRVGKHDEELRPPCKAWKGYLTPFLPERVPDTVSPQAPLNAGVTERKDQTNRPGKPCGWISFSG